MHYVIAGRLNCPQFAYATMIAQRLKEILPQLTYKRISKKTGDWEKWLLETCKSNEWYHITSPIIWREVAMVNGKKYYIGDVSKFLDLCQDYYGLSRHLATGEHFKKSEIEWFTQRIESDHVDEMKIKAKQYVEYRCRNVCILGAGSYAADILIMELLHNPIQNRENGMEIRLYDEPIRKKKLTSMALDAKHCLGHSGLGSCRVVNCLKEALHNIDLVIVLDSFPRKSNESLVKWLKRNRNAMCTLGIALDKYARKHCRVIIGSPSNQPICYNATVLASYAKKLHVRNIVAVTQDLGRETLSHLSQETDIPLKDMHCPPVWGFVGLNKFVDLRRTLQAYNYRVPGPHISPRILQGTEEVELRTVDPFLTDEDINKIFMDVEKHKIHLVPYLGRFSQLAKITAIIDLLKVWGLKQEDGNGEILSLGVYSDGTFNIPKGLYWSQPVTLEKGFWKPFAKYPIPRQMDINLHSFFTFALASLVQTQIKIRKYKEPKAKRVKKEARKFDVEKLKENLNIPVVKTENQCLELLKRLAKEELNIDFDGAILDTITEESVEAPPEEVIPDQVYCECWRRESLNFRKIVLDRSSTTEIEVDLMENLSGPEWDVVNPSDVHVSESSCEDYLQNNIKDEISPYSSSGTIVCDCEEECHCMASGGGTPVNLHESAIAQDRTQNVENGEKKQGEMRKEVRFDRKDEENEEGLKFHIKFYGAREAIATEEKRENLLKRIEKYERGGEDKEAQEAAPVGYDESNFPPKKFHVSVDDGYEIVGDTDGLETFGEMRKTGMKESTEGFDEMWADKVTSTLQVLSSDSESQSTNVDTTSTGTTEGAAAAHQEESLFGEGLFLEEYNDKQERMMGDGGLVYRSNLEVIPEGENEDEEPESFKTLQERIPVEEQEASGKDDANELLVITEADAKGDLRRIPSCYLCRCIFPEGTPTCTCEVDEEEMEAKEASEEILCGEESIGESAEEKGPETEEGTSEVEPDEESEEEEEEEEEWKGRNIFGLPPESFFPFSPKPINKFTVSERPSELCRDANPEKPGFPPEVYAMLEEVKKQMAESFSGEGESRREKNEAEQIMPEETDSESQRESGEMDGDFYSAKVCKDNIIKEKMRSKYLKWLDTVPGIRDEFSYEIAVDEASEDENFPGEEFAEYFEN